MVETGITLIMMYYAIRYFRIAAHSKMNLQVSSDSRYWYYCGLHVVGVGLT